MVSGVFTPYSTGVDFFGAKPSWIQNDLDIQRIQSYGAYEQMYWGQPDIFEISLRGSNALPIYIPAAKTIIDTTNRYYGADFKVTVSGSDAAAGQMALSDLMKRERIRSKMNGMKRYCLIQGDAIWHLTADMAKPVGRRLKLTALDPGMYFPITDDDDVDKIVGVHLVELITTNDGPRIRRITYRKVPRADGFNSITVEEGIFKPDKWNGPTDKPETILQPVTTLPDLITSIPVYHTKNTENPGDPFGSSEIRGLERIIGAIDQAVSDESLALALMGIGMYATDASHPVNEKGERVPWQMGPGRVVHHDGTRFDRVQGVGNLGESYGTHYSRLWEAIKQASSTPDVAIGTIDVSVAQSGIALALQLSPMLAKSAEKNDLLLDTANQMFYDILTMWMAAYEETTFSDDTSVDCVVGNGVPIDRESRFKELGDMLDRGVIDTEYYRNEAKKMGYTFPDDIGEKATAEFDARNAVTDPFSARLTSETDPANGGAA